jgi:hypothetical protein
MKSVLTFQALSFALVLFVGIYTPQGDLLTAGHLVFLAVTVGPLLLAVYRALSAKRRDRATNTEGRSAAWFSGIRLQLLAFAVTLALFIVCMWDRVVAGRIYAIPSLPIMLFLVSFALYVVLTAAMIVGRFRVHNT